MKCRSWSFSIRYLRAVSGITVAHTTHRRLSENTPASLWFLLFLSAFLVQPVCANIQSNGFNSSTRHFSLNGNWQEIDMPSEFETWSLCSGTGGNVWIGSTHEIARYDGLMWERIALDLAIMEGPVKAIHRSKSGDIYILTPTGFYRLKKEAWEQIATVRSDHFPKSTLFEAADGSIWVGHDAGISVLMPDGSFANAKTGDNVITICEDINRDIWFVQGEFREVFRLKISPPDPGHMEPGFTWEQMLEPYEEPVRFAKLLSTEEGHIRLGDIKRNDMTRYYDLKSKLWKGVDLSNEFGSNEVSDMVIDHRGRIWISTNGKLLVIDESERTTYTYPSVPMPQSVTSLEVAEDGSLWISSINGRPIRIDLETPSWEIFQNYHYQCSARGVDWFIRVDGKVISVDGANQHPPKPLLHAGPDVIEHPLGIFRDSKDRVWVVGSHHGGSFYSKAAVSIYEEGEWKLMEFPEFASGFDYDSFCELEDGRFLIGCGQFWDSPNYKRGGLLELREVGAGNWVSHILPAEPAGLPDRIHEIVARSNGDIFVGGSQLTLIREGKSRVINESLGQISLWPSAVKCGPDGVIWGASFGKGVFRIDGENHRWFHAFDDGLEEASIIDLAILKNGDPVALTTKVIYRFDGQNWVEALKLPLELPLSEGSGTLKVADDGTLWINLAHASWYFQWIQDSGYSDLVTPKFHSLRYRFDEVGPKTFIETNPSGNSKDTSFSGKIGGWDQFSKTARRDLQFSYRLDQNPWTPFSDHNTIEIQQLVEGRHVIEARARDLDFNIDPMGASITMVVQIPMWRQKWFIPMIIALIIFSLVSYLVIIRNRSKYLLELEHQKLSFFTNLTHEIRTPLAKVVAPIERALTLENSRELNRYLQLSQRSLGELTRIVDQLLDFRRAQSGVMSSSPEHVELVGMMADFVRSMEIIANEKEQVLLFETKISTLDCRVDVVKIRSILNNLVLNSIRYSPNSAQIRVQLRLSDRPEEVIICVEDRGYGMDTHIVKHAFEPFKRGTGEFVKKSKGTGIGLAYVNELIKIIAGSITVESPVVPTDKETPGTRMTMRIPIEAQLPLQAPPEAAHEVHSDVDFPHHREDHAHLPVLLIAEDDPELAEFLKHELEGEFQVLLEANGVEALQQAMESIPDIMVVDRMMPKMDGFELCRRIRGSELLEHIPLIMLTAASSPHNELEALKSGVNDFVGKPFSVATLLHRIRNQLAIRDSARAKIRKEIEASILSKEAQKIEDPFVRRVIDLVDGSLADYQFGTDQLGDTLLMSRSTLYRKIGATFNMSPPDLIRSRRMQKAGTLLIGTKLSVAEVMDAVGIIEHRTFNKWFKSTYGCSPTEFRKKKSSDLS